MKRLIIAEKPSLAKNVKAALSRIQMFSVMEFRVRNGKASAAKMLFSGNGSQKTIFYESPNYIITNCFGHLFDIGTIDDYLSEGVNGWELANLPVFPDRFKLKITDDDGVKKQFELIRYLVERSDVGEIINCGDADREGELIVRNVLEMANNRKPVLRLWLPEQTEQTILTSINNLQPDSNYDNLAAEGQARTYMDWLFGFNYSRYIIIKTNPPKGESFNAGRVIIPIVEEIYNREQEIKNFVPKTYYQVEGKANKGEISFALKDKDKFDDKISADNLSAELNSRPTIVKAIESKEVELKSKKLFSLDKLQGKLAKDLKMDMATSMPIIQKLYEGGYITYPRTNTEYLAVAEQGKIEKLIDSYKADGISLVMKKTKAIFDDSKVESHSAITPTLQKPQNLSADEKSVYDIIVNRFCAVFALPCKVFRTTVTFINGDREYHIIGDVIKDKGFMEFEPRKKYESEGENIELPKFIEGEKLDVVFMPIEKRTQAPPRYTTESLNDFLKCPYKSLLDDSDTDDEEYRLLLLGCEIGTVATRTEIITKAIKKYKYIALKNNQFYCTPKGATFISYLKDLKIDLFKDKNIDFNCLLKDVYKGDKTVSQVLQLVKKEIADTFTQDISVDSAGAFSAKREIGKCPYCHSDIVEGNNNYYCSGYSNGCSFKIWHEAYCIFSFLKNGETIEYSKKIKINKTNARGFLSDKKQTVIRGVQEKNGTGDYTVAIEYDPQGKNKFRSLGRISKPHKA